MSNLHFSYLMSSPWCCRLTITSQTCTHYLLRAGYDNSESLCQCAIVGFHRIRFSHIWFIMKHLLYLGYHNRARSVIVLIIYEHNNLIAHTNKQATSSILCCGNDFRLVSHPDVSKRIHTQTQKMPSTVILPLNLVFSKCC